MVNVFALAYRPTLRCHGQGKNQLGLPCGRRAVYMRESAHADGVAFFCDSCRAPGDRPIAETAPFRRVTVQLELHLAGTSLIVGAAHAEVVARIEEALAPLGGMVTVVGVQSIVGVLATHAAQAQPIAGKGKG